MNLIFIGHKSCGKSSLGKRVAERIGYSFIDTDELILKNYSQDCLLTIRELYAHLGEESFRDLEEKVIQELIGVNQTLVATGGGSLLREKTASFLKERGKIFYLELSFSHWQERIIQQSLPSFLEGDKIMDYYHQRKSLYQHYADEIFSLDDHSLEESTLLFLKKYFSYGQ